MRRTLRFAAWFACSIIVMLVLGLAVLQTSWAKDRLLQIAVARANRALHANLSIGRLTGSLFYGAVLDDVALSLDGVPVVEAARVTVKYDPFMLVRRQLVLTDVVIDGLQVHLIQTLDGWNVASLVNPSPRQNGQPTRFAISRVRTAGGEVIIAPRQAQRRVLRDLAFDAALARRDEGLRIELNSLSAHDEPSGFDIRSASGMFGFLPATDVDAVFDLARGDARATGRVSGRREGTNRNLTGVVDIAEFDLSPWVGDRVTSAITGHMTVNAVVPDAQPASVTFTFAGPRAAAMGYRGQDLNLTGRFASGVLAVAGRARAYDAELTLDATWRLPDASTRQSWQFRSKGAYRGVRLDRVPDSLLMPPFDSRLSGSYALTIDSAGWTASTVLERSVLEGAVLTKGTRGRLHWSPGRLQYAAEGAVTGLNLKRIAGPLDLPVLAEARFDGSLNGSFRAEGGGIAPADRVLRATATLANSKLGGARTTHLDVATVLAGPRLEIDATGDFADLTADLVGLSPSITMNLDGDADVCLTWQDIHGPFSVDTLDVAGRMALGPSTLVDQPITAATIDGELTDSVATFRTLTVEGPDVHVSATGVVALGENGESSLTVQASSDDLARLSPVARAALTGAADLTAEISGPAAHPIAHGTLNARQLTYGSRVSAMTLDTAFTVDVPGRDLAQATGNTTMSGTFMKLAGFDVIRMNAKANLNGRELTVDTRLEEAKRTVELEGVVGFTPDDRTVTVRHARIAAGPTVWALPEGQQADLSLGGDRLRIRNLTLVRDTQQIDVGGELSFDAPVADGEGLHVEARGVRVEDINALLAGTRSLGGVADATLTVRGSVHAPMVAGDLTIADARVDQVHFEQARASVHYAENVAKIDGELVQSAGNRLVATGVVPIAGPGLDLRVTSTPVDLAFVQAFTTELANITGTGAFDLHLTGARTAPVVDGTVALENGAFAVEATGVRYRGLTAQLAFNRGHLDVQTFRVLDDNGHELRAEGNLDVLGEDGARTMNVRLVTDGFRVLNNKFGNAQLDGELTVDGDFRAPKIAGRMRLAGGRIEVDRLLETTTRTVYSTQPEEADAPAAPSAPDTLFGRVDLALQLRLPDDLVLRGRNLRAAGSFVSLGDMNIVAGGTLDLQKRPGGPLTAAGNLGVVRGFYSFQGRRFEVQRDSAVRFVGSTPVDPALNVTALQTISGVEASVHLGGTMREPTVNLSSRPSLDEAEVLSLIVFGQSVNDLGTNERTTLSDKAASMAAGVVASPIADSIARALNLDLVEIQAPTDASAPSISLGSQLGSRVYVGVKQEVGGSDTSMVSIEYRIASVLRLVTSIAVASIDPHIENHREGGGVDLLFVVHY